MRQSNMKGRVNYSPSSLGGPVVTPSSKGGFRHYPEKVEGTKLRDRSETFGDHYSQATLFYNSMSEVEKKHILEAAVFELGKVETKHVRERMVTNFFNVNEEFARALADKIGVEAKPPKDKHTYRGSLKASKALTQHDHQPLIPKGRKVAVLLAEGFSSTEFNSYKKEFKASQVEIVPVSNKLGTIKSAEGESVEVMKTFVTTAPYVFDGLIVLGGKKSVDELMTVPKATMFINETFRHNKPLSFSRDAMELFKKSNIPSMVDLKKLMSGDIFEEHGMFSFDGKKVDECSKRFVEALGKHRHWERNGDELAG